MLKRPKNVGSQHTQPWWKAIHQLESRIFYANDLKHNTVCSLWKFLFQMPSSSQYIDDLVFYNFNLCLQNLQTKNFESPTSAHISLGKHFRPIGFFLLLLDEITRGHAIIHPLDCYSCCSPTSSSSFDLSNSLIYVISKLTLSIGTRC